MIIHSLALLLWSCAMVIGQDYPVLSVPVDGFKLHTPDNTNNNPSPNSIITLRPQSSCDMHIIVRPVNITVDTVDIKISNFVLAKGVASDQTSPVWCTSAKDFPPNPNTQTITMYKGGSSMEIGSYAIPTNTITSGSAKLFNLYSPTTGSAPNTAHVDILDYQFSFSNTAYLKASGILGIPKWPVSCPLFHLGESIACICLQPSTFGDRPYTVEVDFWWVSTDFADPNKHNNNPLQITKKPGNGEWEFEGFTETLPSNIYGSMAVSAWGHYPSTPDFVFGCEFACPGTAFNITTTAESSGTYVECTAPVVAKWVGVNVGTECTFQIIMTPKSGETVRIPASSQSAHKFLYNKNGAVSAVPLVTAIHLVKSQLPEMSTSNYVALDDTVLFNVESSCPSLMFKSLFEKKININFDHTLWGADIEVNHTTKLLCLDNFTPKQLIALEIFDADSGTKLLQTSLLAGAFDKSQWNILTIIPSDTDPTKPTIQGTVDRWPLKNLGCKLSDPAPLSNSFFELSCGSKAYYLNDSVPCYVQAGNGTTAYPPVESGNIVTIDCVIGFPTADNSPLDPPVNYPVTFLKNGIPYIGLVDAIVGGTTKVKSKEAVQVTGQWSWDTSKYFYDCEYTVTTGGDDVVNTVTATPVVGEERVKLSCEAPDADAWSGYPVDGKLNVVRHLTAGGSQQKLPGIDKITISGPSTSKAAAGIVVGLLLGITLLAGGAGGYVYWRNHNSKSRGGFAVIQ